MLGVSPPFRPVSSHLVYRSVYECNAQARPAVLQTAVTKVGSLSHDPRPPADTLACGTLARLTASDRGLVLLRLTVMVAVVLSALAALARNPTLLILLLGGVAAGRLAAQRRPTPHVSPRPPRPRQGDVMSG